MRVFASNTGARSLARTSARGLAVLALAGSFSAAAAAPAHAFDPVVINGVNHFVECKILLITNPIQHALRCLPSRVPPSFQSLSTTGTGVPPSMTSEPEEPECEPYDWKCICEYEHEYKYDR